MDFGYRILSQTVQISNLAFEKCSFNVATEIAIISLRSNLTQITLNLGRDCILPNEEHFQGNGEVSINGIKSEYTRENFKLQFPEENDRSILTLKRAFAEAGKELNGGELVIEIPQQCLIFVQNQKVMVVHIDIIVSNPNEGIKFCYNETSADVNELSGAHLFTFRSNPLSSTKEWLPCAEQLSQLCVWRFEVTVPKQLTAICCGDLIDTTSENEQKTFHYQLLVPTSAANIGFAIGDFQMYVQPEMPEIISFVIPQLMPLLRHTMSSLNRIFVFFEEFLSCRFPYGTYWQVFVNQTPDELTTFAGLSIFSLKILYHKKILDLVQYSRQILAKGVAQQFFGSFINSADFSEIWLTKALSSYCIGIFVDRFFGTCEYFYQLRHILNDACEYESRFGGIIFRNKSSLNGMGDSANHFHFDQFDPRNCSPLYLEALAKKGHFLMRMLEKRLPKEQFTKVLQRILSIGMQHSQNLNRPIEWSQLLISTQTFMRIVTDVSGQEFPSFIDQWIDTAGHVQFHVSHTFNRKRNIIEVELRQTSPPPIGQQIYAGPLTVVVQEIDGHFVHTLQVDAAISKHDIQCHSKGRKLKKKKIMLGTGEEVEMDLAQMDADSPILWIRIDPELLLCRQLTVNQPFYQWELLLLHERDIIAQQMAIEALHNIPRHQTRIVLEETVRNEKLFYRIRRDAAFSLVHVYNSLPESQLGESPPLIDFFRQQFCCKTCPDIPQPNNYVATSSNLQNYFLLQVLPSAIGSIRGQGGKICPDYVVDFLLGLVRFNDNSINRYSDDHYRAALIHALGKTLVIADRQTEYPEEMAQRAMNILEEVTHALNMDTMKPSFGRVISQHCLQVLYELQRCQHIPQDTEVFWKFGQSKNVYAPLRSTALACIVAMIRRSRMPEFMRTSLRLIEVLLNDPDPSVRLSLANRLCTLPPFECGENVVNYPMNTKRLAIYLWSAISNPKTETRLRAYLADLYFILYGKGPPANFSNY